MDSLASDAERHAAIERLRDAGGEGRLTYEELADRVPAPEVAVRSSQRAAVFGDLELIVPEGVAVELRAATIFGDVTQDTAAGAPGASPDAPRVIVGGWSVFGDVKVVSRRLRSYSVSRPTSR